LIRHFTVSTSELFALVQLVIVTELADMVVMLVDINLTTTGMPISH